MWYLDTRQNRKGNWWCNGVVEGMDESFEGTTILHARKLMFDFLERRGISLEECHFTEPKLYKPHPSDYLNSKAFKKSVKNLPGFSRMRRLDYNPIG